MTNKTQFTKEQLIEEAKQSIKACHALMRVSPEVEAHKISLRLAEIALASLKAEPVAWLWSNRKHPSEVTLVRPEDDEKAEAALWSGWSCQALCAAPPASVVPDEGLLHMAASAIEDLLDHCDPNTDYYSGVWADVPAKLRRAAMLEGADGTLTNEGTMLAGNSPVTPDGWISVSERMPDETQPVIVVSEGGVVQRAVYQFCESVWRDWYDLYDDVNVEAFTHWMPLPAAPQQEKN